MRKEGFGTLGLGLLIAMIAAGPARAGANDYRFEPAISHLSASPNASIRVRLIHVPTGKPVADAILLPARLEMPMAGTAPMIAKATPKGGDGKGIYELVADLQMSGTWTLKLSAKAQGETETITGAVPIAVMTAEDHKTHR
ncbi:MAG: FixH family protein [Rhodospirillales bacterium]|jgi:hypothetical protein|nr:FixH family protein [Rhodospirillales bacterium]